MSEEAKVRRAPGRPRKTPRKKPPAVEGSTDEPEHSHADVEMKYYSPYLLKKALGFYLKQCKDPLICKFKEDRVELYCRGKLKKNRIRIMIDANKLHRYFHHDGSDIVIGVQHSMIETLCSKIDKSYEYMRWYLSNEESNYCETVVDLHNDEVSITDQQIMSTVPKYNTDINEDDFEFSDYDIEFTMPCRAFKKKLGDAKKFKSTITMMKAGKEPFKFKTKSDDGHYQSIDEVKGGGKKINFKSNISDNKIFTITADVSHWSNVVASFALDDKVTVKLAEGRPICVETNLGDGVISVKILTDIVDIDNV